MSERAETLLWLLVLLVGVAATVLQLEDAHHHRPAQGHGHAHDHGSAHKPRKLFSWEAEQARRLMLVSREGGRLEFRREGEGWAAAVPSSSQQSFNPQSYLDMFSQARSDREIPVEASLLESYGLQIPELRILVEDATGQVLAEVDVGHRTPDGFGRYVFLPSLRTIHIVPNYQFGKAFEALGQ